MTSHPRRISVIVPTFNRPAMLRQALASIRALEGPDYAFEILVGDNGTAPETREAAEAYGAVYIKVDRTGAGAARNAGLRAATGEYLCFLDDDDVWLPTHLSKHFELLDARPELDGVIGQVISADQELRPLGDSWPIEAPGEGDTLLRAMLSGYFPQIGTTVARARIREAVGEFDESLIGGQDLDWLLRIARRRTMAFAAVSCLLFRERPYGTYDALNLRRINFDRIVFLRHSVPEWRIWSSPAAYLKAYARTLGHFYQYFVDAAVSRVEAGDHAGAARAISGAFRVFPLRAAYHSLAPRPLRKAVLAVLIPLRRSAPSSATAKD